MEKVGAQLPPRFIPALRNILLASEVLEEQLGKRKHIKRYESHPICADLQEKILQCYRQHARETLSCSALASQYLHCVNHAKQQNMLGRGG
ncbi:hypothetical protein AV530_000468 [Patagioenas fasciata monilis]|uniref:Coiled-coil-helix-coiled-coil-helix domain-containing protein 3, mitochondrial n=1 Tax=Patagioenas fasciata monilis TaxID=372326 RepID=A0A1V4JZ57_PATFA|nr:hypothetical protein AV530_000468 [Patagioenas fasciata monilis]